MRYLATLVLSLLLFWPQPQATAQTTPTGDTACSGVRGPFTLSISEPSRGDVYAQPTQACAEQNVEPGDPRCKNGGTACTTEGAACTTAFGEAGTCQTQTFVGQCIRCSCVATKTKSGGSQSTLLVDAATQKVFRQVKTLAGQGQTFQEIIQAQFTLQTFQRLPIGTEALEPTALTGGRATLLLTSTEDPNVVSVRLLRLKLEGLHFAFTSRIKAITGTLDLRTGAFHLTLSFTRLMTPETPQPFTWEGTADGVYDFELGIVSLTEVGQGAFLAK